MGSGKHIGELRVCKTTARHNLDVSENIGLKFTTIFPSVLEKVWNFKNMCSVLGVWFIFKHFNKILVFTKRHSEDHLFCSSIYNLAGLEVYILVIHV